MRVIAFVLALLLPFLSHAGQGMGPGPGISKGSGGGGGGITLTSYYSTLTSDYRSTSTVSKPANVVDGDFLLAAVRTYADQAAPTPPSGWTLIASRLHSDSARGGLWVYYKRASSEGASWSWTHAYDISTAAVYRITGVVSSGSPEDIAESTCELDYSISAMSCASITTATANAAVMMIAAAGTTSVQWSTHDLTQRVEVYGGAYPMELTIDGALQASAGATGAKTTTPSDYTRAVGVLIALKPQ